MRPFRLAAVILCLFQPAAGHAFTIVPADDGSERGRFYGVLGLDIQSPEYFQRLEPIKRATVRAMVTGFFVAFLTASMIWFLRNFILVVNERRFKLYRRANAELQQRAQAGLYPQP